MRANEAPEKLYVELCSDGVYAHVREWENSDNIEYTRTDAFIDKACKFLYSYNQNQVLKHGAKAILGCGEYTINVEDFKNYMKGE